ncbi:histidinol-phosphatase HisJ family protein [Clostridium cellulovorans]|uniref:Histidinol-phosphatase n=1 Tax=Clostridium cellulovorans (strain ATCC 35296 / DSM 3052 / OCM 3 / 743B) TaxID=573061 RepID=D9STH0_CLOC7|nr:histidinol-phosphatase HisJ family protein [Clostridium cellulovorans]ADL52704.1 histidinol phosphate phosphatase HisJ family [Clostridium cellulovorans 743B]
MNFNFDTHVHSTFSVDAKDNLEDIVSSAIAKGLKHICFTEHIDHNPKDYGYQFYDFEKYSNEIERLKDKFSSEIQILKGIEFSEPHLYKSEFEKELNRDYDMIMASLHWLGDNFYGEKELLSKYSPEKILEKYFKDLTVIAELGNFDVLAHFDFPRRYYGQVSVDNHLIEDILKFLVRNNIVLEINTSGLRKGYNFTLPNFDIIDMYLNLGGKNVTLGSDAHSREEIGADFGKINQFQHFDKLEFGIFKDRQFQKLYL